MTEPEISKLKNILLKKGNAVVIMHTQPDGDAVGSALGFMHYLTHYGYNIKVITPNAFPDFLKWMPGSKSIIDFKKTSSIAIQAVRNAGFIICVDFNALKRIDELGKEVSKSKAFKLNIDHHPQPEAFADVAFHKTEASSTAELIFDFMSEMGDAKKLNKAIANCLYAGIMTDTGSFHYASTTAHTHEVVAQLIKKGAENARIHRLINDNNREKKVRLTGYSIYEKMKIFPEFSTGFITLTLSELKQFDFKEGDTEGLVNVPVSVKGISFSALFTERENGDGIRMSFRSKKNFDVNLFARKHFEGGGHKNAAGGKSPLSMDETIIKFLGLLAEYKDELMK
jgi:phosphoesterase RecJ-like protein